MTIKPKAKWSFAIGTTSIVPKTECKRHYLMVDIDDNDIWLTEDYFRRNWPDNEICFYPTPNGWHVYTDIQLSFVPLIHQLSYIPGVDRGWLRIGRRRGYLFLADYKLVILNWPVIRMTIHHGKKENNAS